MTVKDGLNAEQARLAERLKAKVEERRRWAELQRTYERCVVIADDVWSERLDAAQTTQQTLAETMRDRGSRTETVAGKSYEVYPALDREIPVPLFTPRDRQQFIKEVATTLLIEANRRNLTVTPEVKDAPPEPPQVEATAPEAASGTDELSSVEVAPA